MQKRAIEAEQEANAAYKQIDKLKKKHEREINNLNQLLEVSSQPKERSEAIYDNSVTATYEVGEVNNNGDKQWTEEFKSIYNREEDLTNLGEPSSWFSGYDRCNI